MSIRFRENSKSVDLSEAFEGGYIRVSYWTDQPNSFGSVDLEEKQLRELRKWVSRQINTISKRKKSQTKSIKQ